MKQLPVEDSDYGEVMDESARRNVAPSHVISLAMAALKGSTGAVPAEPTLRVRMDYRGVRTWGVYYVNHGKVEITDGPLASPMRHRPSHASGLVTTHVKGRLAPRNGWEDWIIEDTGQPIQSVRTTKPRRRRGGDGGPKAA